MHRVWCRIVVINLKKNSSAPIQNEHARFELNLCRGQRMLSGSTLLVRNVHQLRRDRPFLPFCYLRAMPCWLLLHLRRGLLSLWRPLPRPQLSCGILLSRRFRLPISLCGGHLSHSPLCNVVFRMSVVRVCHELCPRLHLLRPHHDLQDRHRMRHPGPVPAPCRRVRLRARLPGPPRARRR